MPKRSRPPASKATDVVAEEPRNRSFWSGTITFGLVSIPVDFYAASRPRAASLRMVTKEGRPVGRRYVCPRHRKPVPIEELARGFELESGDVIVVTDEELEAVAPDRTRDIDLKRFVLETELDPLLFARPYVLAPAGGSTKAYRLLAETMEQSKQAGIANFVMRDKAHVVAIVAQGGVLHAQTLRFAGELRRPESIDLPAPSSVSRARTKEFLKAVDELTRDELDAGELQDDYAGALRRLAEEKAKRGKDLISVEQEAESEHESNYPAPIDLVALLKQRLESSRSASGSEQDDRSKGGRPTARAPLDLDQEAKERLYERAKALGIEGRSRMTKKALVKAIQKAAG